PNLMDSRLLSGFLTNTQIGLIRVAEAWTFQSLAGAALIVIVFRQVAVGGAVVKQVKSFGTSCEALVEFSVSFCKDASIHVGSPKIESTDPCVQLLVGIVQKLNGLPRVFLLQRNLSLNQLRISRRLKLGLRRQFRC